MYNVGDEGLLCCCLRHFVYVIVIYIHYLYLILVSQLIIYCKYNNTRRNDNETKNLTRDDQTADPPNKRWIQFDREDEKRWKTTVKR